MRTVLIIVCVCVAFAASMESDKIAETISGTFSITVEDARQCINKTQVTRDDFRSLLEEIRQPGFDPLNRVNALKATCTLACAAQKDGTMVGATFQPAKLHAQMDRMPGVPEELKPGAHRLIDICCDAVKDETEACETMLKHLQCLRRES